MNPEHVRELWRIRFLKILELEEDSRNFYQKILEEKADLLEEAGVKSIVKQIMRDEERHIRIARELVSLVDQDT